MSDNWKNFFKKETFLVGRRPFFWIAGVIFIVFLPTLFYSIVYLDDNVLAVGHYQFNRHLINIFQAFGEDIFRSVQGGGSFYRPILRWTFIFDAQFGEGLVIFMSHLTNMILHIISICLLFYLLLKFEIKKGTALLLSLIFAVHPLTSQTVAFIAGRNDSLLAIFVFPSLIFFLDFLKNNDRRKYVWHLIFLTLALFTKETAVILPALCFVYAIVFIGARKIIVDWKKYAFILTGWLMILVFWFAVRRGVLENFIGNADYNIFKAIFNNFPSILPAIGKIILPFGLSVFPVLRDMSFFYGIVSLIFLACWFLLSQKKNYKLIMFGFSWFLLFILLTLIKPMDAVPDFSENRIYLPMFGFIFVILGLGEIRLFHRIKDELFRKKMLLVMAVSLIVIFSCVTIYRNQYYKDKMSFWENAVKTSPSFAFNHNNFGAMNYLDKKLDLAEMEFRKALELNPNEKMAHNNLGLIYMDQGDYMRAEAEFEMELKINPYYDNCYANRGLLYYKMGKMDQAIVDWKKTLEINPNYNSVLHNLAVYYYEQKNFSEAIFYAQEIVDRGFPLQLELQRLLQPTSFLQLPAVNLKK